MNKKNIRIFLLVGSIQTLIMYLVFQYLIAIEFSYWFYMIVFIISGAGMVWAINHEQSKIDKKNKEKEEKTEVIENKSK